MAVAWCPAAAGQPVAREPGDRLFDLPRVEHVHVGETEAALQVRGLPELLDHLGAPAEEQVAVLVERAGRVEDALAGAPELEAALGELDLQWSAELLANAPEGAAGRAAGERALLDQPDVGRPFFGQVIGQGAADDAPADHDRARPLGHGRTIQLRRWPSSRSRTSTSFTPTSKRSRASRSKSTRARSWPSWAATGPARRPRSRRSPA